MPRSNVEWVGQRPGPHSHSSVKAGLLDPGLMFGVTDQSALRLRVKINADVRRHIHRLTVANKRFVAPEPHRVRSLGFQRTITRNNPHGEKHCRTSK